MRSQTAARLHTLNKQFYQTFGHEFSSTRLRLQPGVLRVLDRLTGDESILDLGCGNGELARELMRRGHRGRYTGLDFSLPLLDVARHGWEDAPATFVVADLMAPDWEKKAAGTPPRLFDWLTAFAVLHHVPGQDARLNLLKKARSLMPVGGQFVHSEWQFLNSAKLRARIQPWSEAGLSAEVVDPDDYLLDWRSGGRGLRYVHHFNEAELDALAIGAGFRVREVFHADGTDGQLAIYQIWEAV
jgi:tRNA (uracil-5-)-methyltransferase TRM9